MNCSDVSGIALFNLAIDSKLRGCDLVQLKVQCISQGGRVGGRAIVMQQITKKPVQFKLSKGTRLNLANWLREFVTGWMGENHFETAPTAAYGVVLCMCAFAYSLLARRLISNHPKNTTLAEAIGEDRKGKYSIFLYLAGIVLSFVTAWFGFLAHAAVSVMWLVPDRRIEEKVGEEIEEEKKQEEERMEESKRLTSTAFGTQS